MSKVRLSTLTPVHIGSGNVLHSNIDFVKENLDGTDYLGVVDQQKVLEIIGTNRVDSWVSSIEKGQNIAEFIQKCSSKKLTIEDYSSRLIYCPQAFNMDSNEPMKEYIHDGFGNPYIPGSSLKGAIRTALFSHYIEKSDLPIDTMLNLSKKTPAQTFESKLFGADPNSDSFRFLQVGDVYFNNECEEVYNMINLNERQRQSFIDKSKHQLVEAIWDEDPSRIFHMKLSQTPELSAMIEAYNQRIAKQYTAKKKNPIHQFDFADLSSMFAIINNHTSLLLQKEVEYWSDPSVCNEDGVSEYVDAVKRMIRKVKSCKQQECVLRVGHASGWRFTTGAWAESFNEDNRRSLVNVARPNNQKKYFGMPFPKSRRINYYKSYMTLMGFVKLTIVE